jgi:hypothetical protein
VNSKRIIFQSSQIRPSKKKKTTNVHEDGKDHDGYNNPQKKKKKKKKNLVPMATKASLKSLM